MNSSDSYVFLDIRNILGNIAKVIYHMIMNIFLDTTTLYTDPFLSHRVINILINLAKEKYINIYVSEIVCYELAKNTRYNQKKNIKEINRLILDYNKYTPAKIKKLEIEPSDDLLVQIKDNLIKNNINIIDCDYNIIIEKTLDKYLNNKKPFDFNKNSFKDSLIWLTYVTYIKNNKLRDNYFISDNTTDFFDKNNAKLHSDLLSDNSEITYYKNLQELSNDPLFKTVLKRFESLAILANEHKLWYEKNITDDMIKNLFYDKFYPDVEYEIYNFCSRLDASEYGDYTFNGFIDNDSGFDIDNFEILNIDFLPKIYILGQCDIQFEANVLGKNPDPDLDEEEFFIIYTLYFCEKSTFSIVINEKHEYESFEISFDNGNIEF